MRKAISFFTGAGGLDIGIQEAGFEIKLSVEINKTFCKTLNANHPELNVKQGNIMDYNKEIIYNEADLEINEEIDLIFGGSPCQSFSTAGKRQAFSDPRGQAMLKFAELVCEVKPKMFLLENVKGLLSAALKHRPLKERGKDFPPLEPDEMPGSAVNFLLKQFNGYKVETKIINAADHGVPQTRERVFFVGVRDDLLKEYKISYTFPEKTHDKNGQDGYKKWVTLGEILKELDFENHHYVEYSEERLKYMEKIPLGGGNWRDLDDEIVQDAMGGAFNSGGGKVGFYRRISINKPAPTLLTSPIQKSTNIGHPFENRPLSIEEYLAIQEFPLNYKLEGTIQQQYVQIGNAVPVRLARVLGESIINFLDNIELLNTNTSYKEVAATKS